VGQSYCDVAPSDPWHAPYHDLEYGFPVADDSALFERLTLEINQAGLSWLTILKKRDSFRRAFEGFDPERVARYGAREKKRLLSDAGIVRNRAKIEAVIENARRIVSLAREHGSFAAWLRARHPRSLPQWCALFRENFRFTGPEIVKEFLLSTGYLPGAHVPACPVSARIARAKPPWMPVTPGRRKKRQPSLAPVRGARSLPK
jgi:DNA-3-methyladenine glycosylase I